MKDSWITTVFGVLAAIGSYITVVAPDQFSPVERKWAGVLNVTALAAMGAAAGDYRRHNRQMPTPQEPPKA